MTTQHYPILTCQDFHDAGISGDCCPVCHDSNSNYDRMLNLFDRDRDNPNIRARLCCKVAFLVKPVWKDVI